MVKEVSTARRTQPATGTTTATILAKAIYREGSKLWPPG